MTTTEIERHVGGTLEVRPGQRDWTPEQRAALGQLGLQKATNADLAVFMHQAQRTGLDPFSRQIYMIARWDSQSRTEKFTIQTGIDGFRVIAERHPQYGGQIGPEWCGADGVWHDVWVSDKPPVAARVGVIRKDWLQPCYATALFREYAGTAKDKQSGQTVLTRMWREKGALMIAKCAEALALRKAFPQDLSGLYTAEEMTQADQATAVQLPQQLPADPDWASKTATPHERATGQPEPAAEVDWEDKIALAAEAGDVQALQNLWRKAKTERPADIELREHITQVADEVKARQTHPADEPAEQPPADEPVDADVVADQKQHRHMHALWKKADVTEREERLAVTSRLIGRDITSSNDLTYADAETVIGRLSALDTDTLKSEVDRWLGEYYAAHPAAEATEDDGEATS